MTTERTTARRALPIPPLFLSLPLSLFLSLGACGGAATETAPPDDGTATSGTETADDPSVIPSPPTPWADMSMEDKRAWMGREVMPRMATLFEGYDAERFGGFGCDGCHGEDAAEREWAMPSASIMTLYATGSEEQAAMVENHRPMVTFMFQEVVPTMQTLLGAEAFDAETGVGFSCYSCHPNGGAGTQQ